MRYEIAIPSYRRVNCLQEKTLTLLERCGINPNTITIFVSDEEDFEAYTKALAGKYRVYNVNQKGLAKTRNAIQLMFPEGTPIMFMDDDIKEIGYYVDKKTINPIGNRLDSFIQTAFITTIREGSHLFGVYAVYNPFFMKKGYSNDLKYCVGACYGIINLHDPAIFVTTSEKEDYERSIKYYIRDGKIIRFNNVAVKTAYYTESGGMQEYRTAKKHEEAADNLKRKYPDFVRYHRKGSEFKQILIGDYRK